MSQNATGFKWTGNKRQAVELVAHDLLSDSEIAKEVGVNKKTLERWKQQPVFTEAVNEAKTAIASALRAQGIAVRQNRIDALNERWTALQTIRQERGDDETIASFPGGKTGFIVATLKSVKVTHDKADDGDSAVVSSREVWEHSFDKPFFSSYQEIERQMAQETGQWEEKQSVTGEMLIRRYVGVDPDDV